jgi:hypothetical protein
MPKSIALVVAGLLLACSAHARSSWSGTGMSDKSAEEARFQALQDLASTLKSDVRSAYTEHTTNDAQNASYLLSVTSDLPILGPDVNVQQRRQQHLAEVALLAERSLPLYMSSLQGLAREIESAIQLLAQEESTGAQELLWRQILANLEDFERYRAVAVILGAKPDDIPHVPATKAEAAASIFRLAETINSLDRALDRLLADMNQRDIFVHAPRARGSSLPTPFARLLQERMTGHVASVSELSRASYVLHGFYDYTDEAMDIVVHLRDRDGRTALSRTVRIPHAVYKNFDYQPKELSFEGLLQTGLLVADELSIRIRTDQGDENLFFTEGQQLRLWVKATKACQIYVVGYTLKDNSRTAYLLPLQDNARGPDMFIRYISPSEANRWFELGEFFIQPPFGVESVQVIASTDDGLPLPRYQFDNQTGLYLLQEGSLQSTVEKAVTQVRALGRIRKTGERAEATLSFVTYPLK